MKRLFVLLFCILLFIACGEPAAKRPTASELPAAQPAAEGIAVDTVEGPAVPEPDSPKEPAPTSDSYAHADAQPAPTPDLSAYTDEQSGLIEALSALSEYYPQWYGDTTPETGTVFSVTVREKRTENGAAEFVYHNEQLDFADLKLSVLSFDPASETEALHLSVAVPQTWSESVRQWFFEDGLRLDFLIGKRHVDAFRERTVTQKGGVLMISYRRCILDEYDRSEDALLITPYVCEATLFAFNSYEAMKDENGNEIKNGGKPVMVPVAFHPDRGETVTERIGSGKDRIVRRDLKRHSLSFAAVSVPLSGTHLSRPPLELLLPVEVEDFDYSEKIGLLDPDKEWNDDPSMSPRGMLYSRRKDFNEVSFTVDAFRIGEDGMELVVSWYLPDDWTDAECRAFDHYDLAVFLNDRHPDFTAAFGDYDSADYPSIFSMPDVLLLDEQHNHGIFFWESWSWREGHASYRSVIPQQDRWKDVHQITIIPMQFVYAEPLPEGGVPYGPDFPYDEASDYSFYERGMARAYHRWLSELAITIDITPDLFTDGL